MSDPIPTPPLHPLTTAMTVTPPTSTALIAPSETLFTDGLNLIFNFLTLNEWIHAIRTCRTWLATTKSAPIRRLHYSISPDGVKPLPPSYMIRHIAYLYVCCNRDGTPALNGGWTFIDLFRTFPQVKHLFLRGRPKANNPSASNTRPVSEKPISLEEDRSRLIYTSLKQFETFYDHDCGVLRIMMNRLSLPNLTILIYLSCSLKSGELNQLHRMAPNLLEIEVGSFNLDDFDDISLFTQLTTIKFRHIFGSNQSQAGSPSNDLSTEAMIVQALITCKSLTSLSFLDEWCLVEADSWLTLSRGLPALIKLHFTMDVNLHHLLPLKNQLQELWLQRYEHHDHADLTAASLCELLAQFIELRSLIVCLYTPLSYLHQVRDYFNSPCILSRLTRLNLTTSNTRMGSNSFHWYLRTDGHGSSYRSEPKNNASVVTPPPKPLVGVEPNPGPSLDQGTVATPRPPIILSTVSQTLFKDGLHLIYSYLTTAEWFSASQTCRLWLIASNLAGMSPMTNVQVFSNTREFPLESGTIAASSSSSSTRPSRTSSKLAHTLKMKQRRNEKVKAQKILARTSTAAQKSTSIACPIVGLSAEEMTHPMIQKILGVLYGQALGDAFGLSCEFQSSTEVVSMYGSKYDPSSGLGSIPFPKFFQTEHSLRWDDGDWTDDTDQMLLILETILESYQQADEGRFAHSSDSPQSHQQSQPSLDPRIFAAKLKAWVVDGFPALGDECGMGVGEQTHQVVRHHQFLSSPHAAARDVWQRGGKQAAANGGLMRTAVTGVFDFDTIERVIEHTRAMCRVTHADPRCVASCILIASLIAAILRGTRIDTPEETEKLISESLTLTLAHSHDLGEHKATFIHWCGMTDLTAMKLDEPTSMGYTLKCMAAGLYGLRSEESFVPTLTRLIRRGGDADTNGAVCGALVGARIGYDGLPADWLLALPNKAWMDERVVKLIRLIVKRREGRIGATSGTTSHSQPWSTTLPKTKIKSKLSSAASLAVIESHPPAPTLIGIEPNPGPLVETDIERLSSGREIQTSSTSTSTPSVTAQTLFKDGLHTIYGFLTTHEWTGALDTCRDWFNAGVSERCRNISYPIVSPLKREALPSIRLRHHLTTIHRKMNSFGLTTPVMTCVELILLLPALSSLTSCTFTLSDLSWDVDSPKQVIWPKSLTALDINLNNQDVPNLIRSIAQVKSLASLAISSITESIEWDSLGFVQDLLQLRLLHLNSGLFGFFGEDIIQSIPLERLPITLTDLNFTQGQMPKLKGFGRFILPNLIQLGLSECRMPPGLLREILTAAPNLTSLEPLVFHLESITLLAKFTRLHTLALRNDNLESTPEFKLVSALISCRTLTHLTLSTWIIRILSSWDTLAQHSQLISFRLEMNPVDIDFACLIPFQSKLVRLELPDCVRSDPDRQVPLDEIAQFEQLEELRLGGVFGSILFKKVKKYFRSSQILPQLKLLIIHPYKHQLQPPSAPTYDLVQRILDTKTGEVVTRFEYHRDRVPSSFEPNYRVGQQLHNTLAVESNLSTRTERTVSIAQSFTTANNRSATETIQPSAPRNDTPDSNLGSPSSLLSSSKNGSTITAQTLFIDGVHIILSFLDLPSWCECLRTCRHFLHAAQTEPNRHIWFEVKRKHIKFIRDGSPTLLRHISYLILPDECGQGFDNILMLKEIIELISYLPGLHTLAGPLSGDSKDFDPSQKCPWPPTLRTWQLYVAHDDPYEPHSPPYEHHSFPHLLNSVLQQSSLTALYVSCTLFLEHRPPQPMTAPFSLLTNLQHLTISHWILSRLCSPVRPTAGSTEVRKTDTPSDYFPPSLTSLTPEYHDSSFSLCRLESFRRLNLAYLKALDVSSSDGRLDSLPALLPQLEILSSRFRNVKNMATMPLIEVERVPQLKEISLVVCKNRLYSNMLSDSAQSIRDASWTCPQLTHLDLLQVPTTTTLLDWQLFAHRFPHVTSLNLDPVAPCQTSHHPILIAFSSRLQQLTLSLQVKTGVEMKNEASELIPQECTQLKTVLFLHSHPSINLGRVSECYQLFSTRLVNLERLAFIHRDQLELKDIPSGRINPRTDLIMRFHPIPTSPPTILPPMDLTVAGIEPNPGPANLGSPSSKRTPSSTALSVQTLFKDGVILVYSYLTDDEWMTALKICQLFYQTACSSPSRQIDCGSLYRNIHNPPFSAASKLVHHFPRLSSRRPIGLRDLVRIISNLPLLVTLGRVVIGTPSSDIVSGHLIPWPNHLTEIHINFKERHYPNLFQSICSISSLTKLKLTSTRPKLGGFVPSETFRPLVHLTSLEIKSDHTNDDILQFGDPNNTYLFLPSTLTELVTHPIPMEHFHKCGSTNLKHLSISECLTPRDLKHIVQVAPRLEWLEDVNICATDLGDLNLFSQLRTVELTTPSWRQATPDPLSHESIGSAMNILTQCPTVTRLVLSDHLFLEYPFILPLLPQQILELELKATLHEDAWSSSPTMLSVSIPFVQRIEVFNFDECITSHVEAMKDYFTSPMRCPQLRHLEIKCGDKKFVFEPSSTTSSNHATVESPPAARLVGVELNPGPSRSHSSPSDSIRTDLTGHPPSASRLTNLFNDGVVIVYSFLSLTDGVSLALTSHHFLSLASSGSCRHLRIERHYYMDHLLTSCFKRHFTTFELVDDITLEQLNNIIQQFPSLTSADFTIRDDDVTLSTIVSFGHLSTLKLDLTYGLCQRGNELIFSALPITLTELSIRMWESNISLIYGLASLVNLTDLTLNFSEYYAAFGTEMGHVIHHLPSLRSFHADFDRIEHPDLFQSLNAPHLLVFDVPLTQFAERGSLDQYQTALPNLTAINFYFHPSDLIRMGERWSQLQLVSLRPSVGHPCPSKDVFMGLATCRQLTNLELNFSASRYQWSQVFQHNPNLSSLTLDGPSSSIAFLSKSTAASQLTSLSLSNTLLPSSHLEYILSCTNLRELSISSWAFSIPFHDLIHAFRSSSTLPKLRGLIITTPLTKRHSRWNPEKFRWRAGRPAIFCLRDYRTGHNIDHLNSTSHDNRKNAETTIQPPIRSPTSALDNQLHQLVELLDKDGNDRSIGSTPPAPPLIGIETNPGPLSTNNTSLPPRCLSAQTIFQDGIAIIYSFLSTRQFGPNIMKEINELIPQECTQLKTITFIHPYALLNFSRTSECHQLFRAKFPQNDWLLSVMIIST